MVLRSFSAIVILILYFLPASALSVTSSPPVVIGTSNSSLATAWNNARKIERTSGLSCTRTALRTAPW
jgi:hypothetical protein